MSVEKPVISTQSSEEFTTLGGIPVKAVYGSEDISSDPDSDIGLPGQYPYTRGIHPNMYRERMWTMRQFAGFGTVEETNARFKSLLSAGQTGLSVAFDVPTLMGLDSDAEIAGEGEFGKGGVACSSLADMEILFDGIPLEEVSVSMTTNSPAPIMWAMLIVAAENQAMAKGKQPTEARKQLKGTLQNDILKEFIAQNEQIFPIEPSMRLVVDAIEFGAQEMPKFNPVSVSGYHIREAGSTAVQELAFTLADGFAYIDACIARGMKVDEVAPKLSFFFNSHNDFFEEIAKFRAARRIWSRTLREKYGAEKEKSLELRFHTQTSGVSLTAQQPENNLTRTAFQAMAGVLGGTQSLHTDAMDEALSLPTDKAARLALRQQQIIAHETGITNTVDPLAGSYYIEALTDEMESRASIYFEEITKRGGMMKAIEFARDEIARASGEYQDDIDSGRRIIVGVNKYIEEEKTPIPIQKISNDGYKSHIERLNGIRVARNNENVQEALEALKSACEGTENVMPYLIQAVREYATVGEITRVMHGVFKQAEENNIQY